MFSGFMTNAWTVATAVAVVAGVVGFFVVIRGSAFPAHAIPNGAFAGAAAANLAGVDPLAGLALFSLVAALGIGTLGRRGRHDVATAMAFVMMLALGALFLSRSTEYEPEVYSLLFGEVLGVSSAQVLPTIAIAAACVTGVVAMYRPLMLSSVLAEVAESKGVRKVRMEMAFLVVLAAATSATVPVVGALLTFSLMVGPPAAARSFTRRAPAAMLLGVALSLVTVWAAIAASYETNWPIGFYVGSISALAYGAGRAWAYRRERGGQVRSAVPPAA